MTDMTSAIVPKSDQINADDLISGPRTIRIRDVAISAGADQPVSIRFEGDDSKVWRPCKSMSRVLVAAWGPDAKAYVGRSVTLYRDPTVKWGGMQVGGIRISHMTNIDKQLVLALTETKGKRAPFVVKPLAVPAAPTEQPRHIPDPASTHPTATLQARADKLEIALKGAGTLARLTAVWQAGRDLRTDLEAGDSIRHASLLALYNRLDLELEAAAGGFPGDEQ
jgi:hypothetical protein